MNRTLCKKGIIVYEESVAKNRSWYIDKYIKAFARYNIDCELRYAEYLNSGNELENVDFAIVRVIDSALSEKLERSGIRVFNSAKVSSIANDKLKCYEYIGENTTVPFINAKQAYINDDEYEYPFIAKSRAGHGGLEVFFIDSYDALLSSPVAERPEDFIFQNVCSQPGVDVRVYVIGGKIVCAMKRMNPKYSDISVPVKDRFLSNYCLGKSADVYEPDHIMKEYVQMISDSLKPDFVGIDFIFDKGKPVFNEVEDVVGARMVYDLTDIDIVELYVEYIIDCLNQ